MTTIRDRVRPVQGNHEQHYHLPIPSNSPAASINNTTSFGIPTMNQTNTTAWVTFTYVSFGVAAGMTALGIWGLPADIWVKGYLSMATVFLIGSCFSLASNGQRTGHAGHYRA